MTWNASGRDDDPVATALAAMETGYAGSNRGVVGWHRDAAKNGLTVTKAEAYLDLVEQRPVLGSADNSRHGSVWNLLIAVSSGIAPETATAFLVRHDKHACEVRWATWPGWDGWSMKAPVTISGALLDALDALDAAGIPTWDVSLLPLRAAVIDGAECGFGPGRAALWAAALDGPLLGGVRRDRPAGWHPPRAPVPSGRPGRWAAVFGPDGHSQARPWHTAGYTPAETRVLLAFPVGHPDRPTDEQLAVMAALRGTHDENNDE